MEMREEMGERKKGRGESCLLWGTFFLFLKNRSKPFSLSFIVTVSFAFIWARDVGG